MICRPNFVTLFKLFQAINFQEEGRIKIKRLLPVHCSDSSAHLRPQVLTDGGDVKRTNQNTIHYSKKLSAFWLPETPTTA